MAFTSSAAIYNRRGQRSNISLISGRTKRAVAQAEYPTDSETRYSTLADCQCKIELDGNYSEILTNFDTIKGTVHFYLKRRSFTDAPQEFKSLRIQLEGIATSKFNRDNQNDDAAANQPGDDHHHNGLLSPNHPGQAPTQMQNEDRFLPSEDAKDSFLSSLCFHFIKANRPAQPQFESLGRESHAFPFEILLTGQTLPASFKNDFGKIDYRLVVYGSLFGDLECVAADKILNTKGCLNLSQDPGLYAPLRVSRQQKYHRSLFFAKDKRPNLKLNFVVNKGGFLPQEILTWQVVVKNPTCERVQRVAVIFVQKIIYFFANQRPGKVTTTVLSEQEFCGETSDAEICEIGRILVEDGLMPTFTKKKNKALEIVYVLQFVVDLVGQPGIKGEIPIVIGTARDEDHEEIEYGADLCCGRANRQMRSTPPDWDTVSIQTCSTLPPSYSNLTSRCPSIETLPPAYEEVIDEGDEDDNGYRKDVRVDGVQRNSVFTDV